MILIIVFALQALFPLAGAIDPLDQDGNITIIWDILNYKPDENGYDASVRIINYQFYRHTEEPGWSLSWTWSRGEVIWTARGAQALKQDDCSRIKKDHLPHSCAAQPVMIDLKPQAPDEMKVANCCRGGVLSSLCQEPAQSEASFTMMVGDAGMDDARIPTGFKFAKLGGLGYSCSEAQQEVNGSSIPEGERNRQALRTWKSVCVYEQFQAERAHTCCVSFSAFYNKKIVPCAECSCGCSTQQQLHIQSKTIAPVCTLQQAPEVANAAQVNSSKLFCSRDMCPIKVHWHLKANYRGLWRAKVTIINRHARNYTHWNLVVEHPSMKTLKEVYSFNSKPLPGRADAAVMWGIRQYNDMLLEFGDNGLVQSEMMFYKDNSFTLSKGWVFPHRIMFNGDECALPAAYPPLPNSSNRFSTGWWSLFFIVFLVNTFFDYFYF